MQKKSKLKLFIENFSYTFSANLLNMLISTITILVLPKFVGVETYGYYQMYILYFSYVGIIQLGWADGVYLKYGGKEYYQLSKSKFGSQFWLLTMFYIVLSFFIYLFIINVTPQIIYKDILVYTLIAGFLTTPRGLLFYILQATNRIKEYGKLIILDRLAYIIILLILLLIGIRSYKMIIISDLVGKAVGFLCTIYICRDIVFSKVDLLKESIKEAFSNISIGFKLMVANFSSTMIVGIVRLNIENNWGIEQFSKVSLTLSISNLFMVFINAVALVLFPTLRRTSEDNLSKVYQILRSILMPILLFMLLLYYPTRIVLSNWLPQYSEGLKYMALLFPIIIYESKMALLINTFLKTLRKEKSLLIINVVTVLFSFITTLLIVYLAKSFNLTILLIVFLLAFRCILAEIIIFKLLKINVFKDILLELILSSIFIYASWYLEGWLGVTVYFISYITYLLIKRNEISRTILSVKMMLK